MARPKSVPKASLHASGQAVVRLDGKDHYLGKHGSQQAEMEYDRLISSWLGNDRRLPDCKPEPMTVNELALLYLKHAEGNYASGRRSSHFACILSAIRICRSVCGRMAAQEFGPKTLKRVRQSMIEKNWSRGYVNIQLQRIRAMFRWAAEDELVPGTVYHALLAVRGLRRGIPGIRETEPVKPVAPAAVAAVIQRVLSPVATMIQLQLLTGARPGEITVMRTGDVEMTGQIWIYRPDRHKTKHHGHAREVYIGPQAQAILQPWLQPDPNAYLFSPAEARMARYVQRRDNRVTPLWPSHVRHQKNKQRPNPSPMPRACYDVHSYRRAIYRACDMAFPPPAHLARREDETRSQWLARLTPEQRAELAQWQSDHRWHPHQLRHNAATNFRKQSGIEIARIILGHSCAFTTEIYAEMDRQQAIETISKFG